MAFPARCPDRGNTWVMQWAGGLCPTSGNPHTWRLSLIFFFFSSLTAAGPTNGVLRCKRVFLPPNATGRNTPFRDLTINRRGSCELPEPIQNSLFVTWSYSYGEEQSRRSNGLVEMARSN